MRQPESANLSYGKPLAQELAIAPVAIVRDCTPIRSNDVVVQGGNFRVRTVLYAKETPNDHFSATRLRRGHHQTVLPSSCAMRKTFRAESGALETRS